MILLALPAFAATPERPPVASDLFRPSFDDGPWLATEVARVEPGAVGGLVLSWAREPLRVIVDGDASPVVERAVVVHLGARASFGPVQVGVTAPGYVVADVGASRTVLGDPTLDLKVAASTERWGVGGVLRAGTSLGAFSWQLGYPGPFAEIGAVGQVGLGPVDVAANLGLRATPEQPLGDVVLDDAFWFRTAASVTLGGWQPAIEVWGQRSLASRGPAVAPVEGLVQVRRRWASGGSAHLGVGTGLSSGVGAPRWRLVLGVSLATGGPS